MDLLENPVWHALTGPHEKVAEGQPPAVRYDLAVAPFAALPDAVSDGAWHALRALVGPGGIAILFRDSLVVPDGWSELARVPVVQMVAAGVDGSTASEAVELGGDDVPEMLALVGRTDPGPFMARTIELGDYIGVRRDDVLVAMAGVRMRLPGYSEISAVCTDAEFRGHGLASALVRDLVARIEARGERAMLHAMSDNTNAIRLYASMGFSLTREFAVVVLRAPT